jgi:hypothetical protein
MRVVLIVLLLTFAAPAWTADNGTGWYSTQSSVSCDNYLQQDKERRSSYLSTIGWVAGYITAYNRQTPDTAEILGNTNLASVMLWLKNYCKAHPLDDLAGAMDVLTIELYPRRHKTRKEAGR